MSAPLSAPPRNVWCRSTAVAIACVGIALLLLALYLGGEARGRMSFITLPAVKWGTPPSLAARGLEPLYLDSRETGWDGQFYYRMANDPLGTGEMPKYIDSPSYRYQRVGMSATAWTLSRLLGRDWVSPTLFYATGLLALALATFVLAAHYSHSGATPWLALVWSAGLGTQLTLLNGLPDGFAEAAIVLAVVALAGRRPRPLLYGIAMTLACLSREVYLSAAAAIGLLHLLRMAQGERERLIDSAARTAAGGWLRWGGATVRSVFAPERRFGSALTLVGLLLPGVVFALWQLYIRAHFHIAPGAQAGGILSAPLREFGSFLQAALAGRHPTYGPDLAGMRRETAMLVVFAVILLCFFTTLWPILRRGFDFRRPEIYVLAFAPAVALYLCFGPVVMMHYSGYLKAANIVLFLVPFAWVHLRARERTTGSAIQLAAIALCGAATLGQLTYDKVLAGSASLARPATFFENARYRGAVAPTPQAALTSFASDVRVVNEASFYAREAFRELRGIPAIRSYDLQVTNRTGTSWKIAEGAGAIRVAYHWMTPDGTRVVADGARTHLQEELPSGETRAVRLHVEFPSEPGDYLLRISLVQEGVAWFYHHNTGYADIHIRIR